MKKRVLIVLTNVSGGVGKSCISLLSNFDYDRFQIDLLAFRQEGLFFDLIPDEVSIIDPQEILQGFWMVCRDSVRYFLEKKKYKYAALRLLAAVKNRSDYKKSACNLWHMFSPYIAPVVQEYDIAVGYMDTYPNYFVADKVSAAVKIAWNHNDLRKLNLDREYESTVFSKFQYIMTVSKGCKNVLDEVFPEHSHKYRVMHNIILPSQIRCMAGINDSLEYGGFEGVKIVSVGNLVPQKGYDIAIRAFYRIIRDGYKAKWYVIGEGPERQKLNSLIKRYRLEEDFILLGERANPYPYIDNADIYVQPSRFEGKSIAIEEAQVLHKPILITNYSTVSSQLEDGIDGLVVQVSEDGIYEGVKRLVDNPSLRMQLTDNLINKDLENKEEMLRLYEIINEKIGSES